MQQLSYDGACPSPKTSLNPSTVGPLKPIFVIPSHHHHKSINLCVSISFPDLSPPQRRADRTGLTAKHPNYHSSALITKQSPNCCLHISPPSPPNVAGQMEIFLEYILIKYIPRERFFFLSIFLEPFPLLEVSDPTGGTVLKGKGKDSNWQILWFE